MYGTLYIAHTPAPRQTNTKTQSCTHTHTHTRSYTHAYGRNSAHQTAAKHDCKKQLQLN